VRADGTDSDVVVADGAANDDVGDGIDTVVPG
jgi:hypothetical protein